MLTLLVKSCSTTNVCSSYICLIHPVQLDTMALCVDIMSRKIFFDFHLIGVVVGIQSTKSVLFEVLLYLPRFAGSDGLQGTTV